MNIQAHRSYTLQIGSFKVPGNAVEVHGRLRNAGLNPDYDLRDGFFRVVLRGIRGTDVQSVASMVAKAGFPEAIIREE
jgi:cell division protein FtsN